MFHILNPLPGRATHFNIMIIRMRACHKDVQLMTLTGLEEKDTKKTGSMVIRVKILRIVLQSPITETFYE